MGMHSIGILQFYNYNFRSLLAYRAPASYTVLFECDKAKPKRIQKATTVFIFSNYINVWFKNLIGRKANFY